MARQSKESLNSRLHTALELANEQIRQKDREILELKEKVRFFQKQSLDKDEIIAEIKGNDLHD